MPQTWTWLPYRQRFAKSSIIRRLEAEALESRPQRHLPTPHPCRQIAPFGNPPGHRLDREAARLHVGNLVPVERRRDPRVRRRADGVRRGDRPVTGVLTEVDEDAAAVGDPPRRRRDLLVANAPLDLLRNPFRKPANVRKADVRL